MTGTRQERGICAPIFCKESQDYSTFSRIIRHIACKLFLRELLSTFNAIVSSILIKNCCFRAFGAILIVIIFPFLV